MKLENSFCLANSDTWLDGDLRSMRFLPGNNVAVIKCAKNERYGEVVFDEKQAVTEFIKNSETRQAYVNVGFYKFNKSVFLNWDGENHSLEETVLPSLVNRRNLNCYVYNGNFIDIGVPDDYKKFVGIYNEEKIFDLILSIDSTVKQAMQKIEKNASGIVFILDGDKKLVGSLSDGDIRRYILNDGKIDDVVNQAMNKSCTSATEDLSTGEILRLMDMGLKLIPVIDEKGRIINIHDRFSMAMVPRIAKTYHGRAPARITFCGGGSDTTAFSKRSPGAVLNASVNVFAHSILKLRKDKKIKIFSSDLNSEIIADNLSSLVDKKKDSEFALIIALMELLQPNFGFDLTLWSDFPKKSGLGSASVLCSVTACMDQVLGYNLTNNEIAELTFQAERLNLGVPGGWQDQYSSAIGGLI